MDNRRPTDRRRGVDAYVQWVDIGPRLDAEQRGAFGRPDHRWRDGINRALRLAKRPGLGNLSTAPCIGLGRIAQPRNRCLAGSIPVSPVKIRTKKNRINRSLHDSR